MRNASPFISIKNSKNNMKKINLKKQTNKKTMDSGDNEGSGRCTCLQMALNVKNVNKFSLRSSLGEQNHSPALFKSSSRINVTV